MFIFMKIKTKWTSILTCKRTSKVKLILKRLILSIHRLISWNEKHFHSRTSKIKRKKNEKWFEKKMKKKVIRISKIKQSKRISKNARSKNVLSKVFRFKDCFASFDIIFVDVVVYNLFSKQKNVKFFVIFFKKHRRLNSKKYWHFHEFQNYFFRKFS